MGAISANSMQVQHHVSGLRQHAIAPRAEGLQLNEDQRCKSRTVARTISVDCFSKSKKSQGGNLQVWKLQVGRFLASYMMPKVGPCPCAAWLSRSCFEVELQQAEQRTQAVQNICKA